MSIDIVICILVVILIITAIRIINELDKEARILRYTLNNLKDTLRGKDNQVKVYTKVINRLSDEKIKLKKENEELRLGQLSLRNKK